MNLLLNAFLNRVVAEGSLEVIGATGKTHRYGDGSGETVRLRIAKGAAERNMVLQPDLKLAEEYMNGGVVMSSLIW